MLLNNTLANSVGASTKNVTPFLVNGKPSVIYFGSITCIFCGENRWAMALALSRFGNFSHSIQGIQLLRRLRRPHPLLVARALQPIISRSWLILYQQQYINFIAIEDTDPITAGFNLQPFNTVQQEINSTGNLAYEDALKYILEINNFQGTPYTIWGGKPGWWSRCNRLREQASYKQHASTDIHDSRTGPPAACAAKQPVLMDRVRCS